MAVAAVPQVTVKEYKNRKAFERDANKLAQRGFTVSQVAVVPGHVLLGHTLLKWCTGIGILTGTTRTPDQYTVTYTRST